MAARAFTALEMHSCWQQGVVMLGKITFAQIADSGHLEWGMAAEEAFQRREFLIIPHCISFQNDRNIYICCFGPPW